MSVAAMPKPPPFALPPCDERIAELYRYWLAIAPGPGVLPGRQHFDPTAVPRLLRWMWLVEFEREPLRFRYRLVGTEHVTALGRDATGEWLEQAHPHFTLSSAYQQFVAAAEFAMPGYYWGRPVYYLRRDWMTIERLILPMARNGWETDLLIGLTVMNPTGDAATAGRSPGGR